MYVSGPQMGGPVGANPIIGVCVIEMGKGFYPSRGGGAFFEE